MLTVESLNEAYSYNFWANIEFLKYFQSVPEPNSKALRVFAHLLLAEITWLRRITAAGLDNTGFDFWAGETLKDCQELFEHSQSGFAAFFQDLSEERLDAVFSYRNSKGNSFENTCREALTHVFTHSAYHRGQVAQAIREGGAIPPYTDFIQFLRLK